jgi:cytochrome c oxidase subunit 4
MASDSLRFYGAIYVALLVAATLKVVFERRFDYWIAAGSILVLASLKTLLIVGYFQHLRWERRSLSGLMALALSLFALLMVAASFSVT